MKQLINKAFESVRKAYETHNGQIFVGNSGGKDSCVVLHITRKLFPNVIVIHNSKLEPGKTHPLTRNFLYEQSAEFPIMFLPSSKMEEVVKKEKLTCQVDGTRRAEFDRTEKSDDVIINGKSVNRKDMPGYVHVGIFGLSAVYPIYDWTDKNVFEYIKEESIKISAEYDV